MYDENEKTVIATNPHFQSKINNEDALVNIYPPGPTMGKKWEIGSGTFIIGRDDACEITIPKNAVSRRHAQLTVKKGERFVEDLGSTNGTFVNEQMVSTLVALKQGDHIKIGDTIFKYLVGTDVESAYHEEIYRMTIKDGLTDIHNKRFFLGEIQRELARTARHNRPLGLVMFDIDHFKHINDTWGHLAGDAVLRQLSNLISGRIRRDEVFARYGGEEFAILVPESRLRDVVHLAEQIRQMVEVQRFQFDELVIPVTISLGVAVVEQGEVSPEQFIAMADNKLYEAKESGRNRVCG